MNRHLNSLWKLTLLINCGKPAPISFEEIALLIESGRILGIEENPGKPDQKIHILEIVSYAVIVPFVEKDDEIFLKTAFPSRKDTKRYGLKGA